MKLTANLTGLDCLLRMLEEVKQRALKITEALYRTTDLFSDSEPLKWSLRQTALDILSADLRDAAKLGAIINNVLIKLELAAGGTFISKMNFDVLRREYSGLLLQVNSLKDNYQNLLDTILSDRPISITDGKSDTPISDNTDNILRDKENIVRIDTKVETVRKPLSDTSYKNSDRREYLLSALKQKGPSSVGDLARALGGSISEKTVQRELSAMVSLGSVRQEGDKRWRKYFV